MNELTKIEISPADRLRALDAAHWVTASPHEWVWTTEQQALMAQYCLWAFQRIESIRNSLEKIVIPDGQDAGVILLSDESPTRYCPEAKCHVYLHENFSPLGDALVNLHRQCVAETQM